MNKKRLRLITAVVAVLVAGSVGLAGPAFASAADNGRDPSVSYGRCTL